MSETTRATSDSVKRNVRTSNGSQCVVCHAPGSTRMLEVAHIVDRADFRTEVSVRTCAECSILTVSDRSRVLGSRATWFRTYLSGMARRK